MKEYHYTLNSRRVVILTFYRGVWCPYCYLELNANQDLLPKINKREHRC
ncbi:redoxin domain-containing protein [Bacillus sp. SA1-12]